MRYSITFFSKEETAEGNRLIVILFPELSLLFVSDSPLRSTLKYFSHTPDVQDVHVKWPNDVWVGYKKLSGVLINASITGAEAIAQIGIGVSAARTRFCVVNSFCFAFSSRRLDSFLG